MRENNLLDFNMYEQSLTQNVKQPNGAYSEQATPPPNLITKDITENGEYSAADDNADGYSSVNVTVGGGAGMPILATPSDIASTVNAQKANNFLLIEPSISNIAVDSKMVSYIAPGDSKQLYVIVGQPISGITFPYGNSTYYKDGVNGKIRFLFKPSTASMVFKYYSKSDSTTPSTIYYTQTFDTSKTYLCTFVGSLTTTTLSVSMTECVEYNEDISFTVE